MSLFNTNLFWQTRVSASEEFDAAHLAVGLFGQPKGNTCIAVGSFKGILRVYKPAPGGYKATHLIYEKDFEEPLLALDIMDTNGKDEVLVMLFHKSFGLYQFEQANSDLKYKTLAKVELTRPAYNMLNFSNNGDDVLCI